MKRAEYKARNNLFSDQIMQNTVYLIAGISLGALAGIVIDNICLGMFIGTIIGFYAEKIFKTNRSRNKRIYNHHKVLKLNLQQHILYGLLLIVAGVVSGALSKTTGGSHVQDFVSGILMALSVAELIAGILFIVKYMTKR